MLKRLFTYPILALLLTACVTINVYFPAAATEEAARTIVRDVLGVEDPDAKKEGKGQAADEKDAAIDLQPEILVIIGSALEWMVPAAHAAAADINIDTPAISRIRSSLRARKSTLAVYYRSGAIGLTNNGLVKARDMAAVALRDRNRLKKSIADENRDRDALYREIARANGHPEWEADIRKTFSRVWSQEAISGYWFQDASGNWQKK